MNKCMKHKISPHMQKGLLFLLSRTCWWMVFPFTEMRKRYEWARGKAPLGQDNLRFP